MVHFFILDKEKESEIKHMNEIKTIIEILIKP